MEKKKIVKLIMSALFTVSILAGCSSKTLKTIDKLEVEYSTPISTSIETYLSDGINKEDKEKILDTGKVAILDDKKVEGKNYQALGEYTVQISYEEEVNKVTVLVKDSVKPVFKEMKQEISYAKDCKPSAEEFSKLFTAEDLSQVTISADDSKVDYTKEGSYKATVTATDEGGNTETKEVTVNVKKPEIKLDVTSKSVYVKESFVLKADVKGKETKPAFKSSNTSVATVSDSGKVTAKAKGTATITAEANGVKAECKITVKSLPSGSQTTTQTVTNPTTGKKEEVVVVKPSKPSSSSGSGTSATATTSKEVFNLINKERAKVGLPALKWDSRLDDYTKTRAKEISTKMSHTRPNGNSGPVDMPVSYGRRGEILAKTTSASKAVNGWMNSPGHKANILDDEFTVCSCAQYGDYWVVLFGGLER